MGPITFDVETLKDNTPAKMQEVKIPQCWVCMDQGFLIYNKEVNRWMGEFIAHCTCPEGTKYMYDGTKCKRPSQYHISSIADLVDPEMMARENIQAFIEKYKDNEQVMGKLQQIRGKA